MAKTTTSKYKMVMLGEAGVGKTAIVNKFMYNDYRDKYEPTIGIDFFSKNVTLASGASVRLQLWDTAGQERFKSLTASYIRDAAVALVVFDITSKATFESCQKWVASVKEKRGDEVIIALVGNKCDLYDKREVDKDTAADYAASVNGSYSEASALEGTNIKEIFQELAEQIAKADPTLGAKATNVGNVRLTDAPDEQSKKACGC
eukprot:Platyproteum_vivax@DN5066_c0_g1_i1.p1